MKNSSIYSISLLIFSFILEVSAASGSSGSKSRNIFTAEERVNTKSWKSSEGVKFGQGDHTYTLVKLSPNSIANRITEGFISVPTYHAILDANGVKKLVFKPYKDLSPKDQKMIDGLNKDHFNNHKTKKIFYVSGAPDGKKFIALESEGLFKFYNVKGEDKGNLKVEGKTFIVDEPLQNIFDMKSIGSSSKQNQKALPSIPPKDNDNQVQVSSNTKEKNNKEKNSDKENINKNNKVVMSKQTSSKTGKYDQGLVSAGVFSILALALADMMRDKTKFQRDISYEDAAISGRNSWIDTRPAPIGAQ